MPTGGVTVDNAGDWIRAGAVAVGVGTSLLDAEAIADGHLVEDECRADDRERPRGQRSELMPRVVTFGELMLRLSPPGFEQLLQSPMLVATFGGGEANVAVSLALFGIESVYITALPKNPIGDAAVQRSGPKGSAPTASSAAATGSASITPRRRGPARIGGHLRRANSSIGDEARRGGLGRDDEGADWLHVTGITPALGANGAEGTRRACAAARAAGAKVSVDLNFRKKLWTETQAGGHGPVDARRRHRDRQRRGPAVGPRRHVPAPT